MTAPSGQSAYRSLNQHDDYENTEEARSTHYYRKKSSILSKLTTIIVAAFICLTIVFSLFSRPREKLQAVLSSTSPEDELPLDLPLVDHNEVDDNTFGHYNVTMRDTLSAPALSWAQRNDRTMTDEQCRQEFPLLYPQLEELVSWWIHRGGVSKEIIDSLEKRVSSKWGHVRLIIQNGQMFIRSFKEGSETRNSALVHLIQTAIDSWPTSSHNPLEGDRLPTVDLILSPGDRDAFPREGAWMVTKRIDDPVHKGTWLIPDFGFVGWPEAGAASYAEFIDLASKVEKEHPWEFKSSRVFWRGFANVYEVRQDLMQRTSTKIDPSRESWADVHQTTFHGDKNGDFVPLVTPQDHCQHKYLIQTEGNSYSGYVILYCCKIYLTVICSRSKYIFSCLSVVISHPLVWTQHFHPALNSISNSTNQNYVQLPGPHFSGLQEATEEMKAADSGNYSTFTQGNYTYLGRNTPRQVAENAARTLRDRKY